ncbi:13202_t:CDS:2 [Entrophospora sp. SA101]|nr:13202_t:CDS:2 [Entrophospora sp. SA101]
MSSIDQSNKKRKVLTWDGWVSNFKKRNNIKQYVMHGEASSAPSEEILSEERRRLQEIIKEFPLENVYNCD